VVVNPGPKVTLSVDTSRLVTDSGATLVWLRFDYAQLNPRMAEVPRAWGRMEAREAIDCRNRRARDVAMTIVDTAGQAHDGSKALSPGWKPFEQHPLTVNAFDPVCRLLVDIEAKRGA
jgi:hypothetical protein